MNDRVDWKEIKHILENIKDTDTLRKLFVESLNYDYANKEALIEFPKDIADKLIATKIISEKDDFKVVFCQIDKLLKGRELPAVKSISSHYPYNIVVFTNEEQNEFHFVNTKYIEKVGKKREAKGFRRITVGKTDRLRTAAERLSMIYAPEQISALDLASQCEEAFDVEAVSKEFYQEFVKKYKELRKEIQETNRLSNEIADSLTQEILNRLLFLYFIQKKGWLNEDYKFLYNNFRPNKKEYYKEFLVPLFKILSIKDFKHPAFYNIPFLNGGLFDFKDIEEKISVPNEAFNDIFEDLLERFNFTIREDTEFEEEVAIDPEMLGRIFEELILSLESAQYKDIPDPRRESGSYYTPRFVVSFMVKQALLNYLTNELPQIPKDKLKALVFNKLSTDEIEEPSIVRDKLLNLKIVDPGVGSGAFSVDILNKLVAIIEKLNEKLGISWNRYELRKKLIEDCIYGVDIQERAIHLARLRLWLSLIVDLDIDKGEDVPPLINLDFKIVKGDSLVSKMCGFKFDLEALPPTDQTISELIKKYKRLKDEYAEAIADTEKQILKRKINNTKCAIAIWHLDNIKKKRKEDLNQIDAQETLLEKTKTEIRKEKQEKERIRQKISAIEKGIKKIKTGQDIDAFNWYLDFSEVMRAKKGFDIVIANPPYGIDEVKEVYQDEFKLGSKDSYGVFAAIAVNILKPGGTLCYIMSDTWQTIRTHKKLRKKLFEETEAQYLISVPMKTFKTIVNTGIYLFKKSAINNKGKDNFIIAADFHGLDIKKGDLEAAFDLIAEEIEPDEKCKDGYTIISGKDMAIYVFRQKIIERFTNLSFFIASPKLFQLMQDVGNLKPKTYTNEKGLPVIFDAKKQKNLFEQEGPNIYQVNFNGKQIELVKLGDVGKVVVGLQTGDNHNYLRQLPDTKGSSYREIDFRLVLKENELEKIRRDEQLRMDVIENGICKNPQHKGHSHRYFGGKYFVPYDKGGASDVEEGWLPNYYVPTPYFIDWSEGAVKRLKTWKKPGTNKITSRFQNKAFYFKDGISFSRTGYYSPTFRFSAGSIFDTEGSFLFPQFKSNIAIAIFSSKIFRMLVKSFIDHSVHSQIEDIKKVPVPYGLSSSVSRELSFFVSSIIQHQKQKLRYDYMTSEQLEIDKLVYEIYNLNEEDIEEVENWYFRRYPKLAKVIEEKLKKKNKGV